MRALSTWLLGGALAASLSWNFTFLQRARAAEAPSEACEDGTTCTLAPDELALEPARAQALSQLCSRSCAESARLERRADELQARLLQSLTDEPVTTESELLVQEIAALRERSLLACVEGIRGIRALLSAEEVHALLERCELGSGCR